MRIKVKGIARYPHLFEPSIAKGYEGKGEKTYSIDVLINKNDEQYEKLMSQLKEAKSNGFPGITDITNIKTKLISKCAEIVRKIDLKAGTKMLHSAKKIVNPVSRRYFVASIPFIIGICISIRIKSNSPLSICSIASLPLLAMLTSAPSLFKYIETNF